ncbi:MAG: aspartate aminotransferase family protein, partial [Gammaproteobacteria bacterium]|nr:aspartate aminotransferase family protein [Gammaproteobacteria bacterium]
ECVSSKKTKKAFHKDLELGKRLDTKCQEYGLILRPYMHLCVFSPPIIITKAQVDEMVGIMSKSILEVADDLIREGIWDGKD